MLLNFVRCTHDASIDFHGILFPSSIRTGGHPRPSINAQVKLCKGFKLTTTGIESFVGDPLPAAAPKKIKKAAKDKKLRFRRNIFRPFSIDRYKKQIKTMCCIKFLI